MQYPQGRLDWLLYKETFLTILYDSYWFSKSVSDFRLNGCTFHCIDLDRLGEKVQS